MGLRIALGQLNSTVGDIEGNVRKMAGFYADAVKLGADVVVFPEMSVSGYPPEDLLLKNDFVDANRRAVERLATDCPKKTIIVGFAERNQKGYFLRKAFIHRKKHLMQQ